MAKTKDVDINYKLIPMGEITDQAREIAKRWYDGVSKLNDIQEKHKLASDIMNYARQESVEFNHFAITYFLGHIKGEEITDDQLYSLYLNSKIK